MSIFFPIISTLANCIIVETGDDLGTREKRACESSKS